MNITGIIAEYNPFHNGHALHARLARTETGADYVIAVMSGNFVQRGTPALIDKFIRAKMALLSGIDLVIELPPVWSCASSEYFAGAAAALFQQLGCVSSLCYGCETKDTDLFGQICTILNSEPPGYRQILNTRLKQGCSFAAAREYALLALLPDDVKPAASAALKKPNNILALEYQKALSASSPAITMHPVLRKDHGYHSQAVSGGYASASAIRRLLESQPEGFTQTLRGIMPYDAFCQLLNYMNQYPLLYENDCSQMLHYSLLKNAADGFSDYADCTPAISNKICRRLNDYTSFSAFCAAVKSKNTAYARISRILMHILLDIRQSDYALWRSRSFVPYARILGFQKESGALLTHLKKHSSLPLLTRASDAQKLLSDEGFAFFQKHLFMDAVYRALVTQKGGRIPKNEFQQQLALIQAPQPKIP